LVDVLITGKITVIRNVAIGTAFYLFAFMIVSLILFTLGMYGIYIANSITAIIALVTILSIFFFKYKKVSVIRQIEFVGYAPIALIIVLIIGLLFTIQKFEIFGMGQDQGVYQINAMLMSEGLNDSIIPIKEYDLMTNDEDRELFLRFTETQELAAGGFYPISQNDNRGTIPQGAFPVNSAMFHGLPNLPAVLSITGRIFGTEHIMIGLTLPYLISIVLIFLTLNVNLELKKSTSAIGALIFALCPFVLWTSKASLTEIYLAMMIAMFCFYLTDKERTSSFLLWIPVSAFAFFHVSVYALMPMFIVLFIGMALYKRSKGALVSGIISVITYCAGYVVMTHVAPSYTFTNYRNIIRIVNGFGFSFGRDTSQYPFIFAVCIIALFVLLLTYLYVFKFNRKVPNIKKVLPYIFMIVCVYCAYRIINIWFTVAGAPVPEVHTNMNLHHGVGRIDSIPNLRIFSVFFGTGFIFLGIICVSIFLKNKAIFSGKAASLAFLFLYCVIIMNSIIMPEISYYYYYTRYSVPYIPIIALMSAVVIDNYKPVFKTVVAAVGILIMLPFSVTLALSNDISFMEIKSQRKVMEIVDNWEEGSIILLDLEQRRFFLNDISNSTDKYAFSYYNFNHFNDLSFIENRRIYTIYAVGDPDNIPDDSIAAIESYSSDIENWATRWTYGPERLLRPFKYKYWIVIEEIFVNIPQ